MLADSKIANLKRFRSGQIDAELLLIGTPLLSQASEIVIYADISHNSELVVIDELAKQAKMLGKMHQIILMIELGDLREGIMPEDLDATVREILKLSSIKLVGLGTNLACFGGIEPTDKKMDRLSQLADEIETKFHLHLEYISGGNSANYDWFKTTKHIGRINQLRIGESIFLGVEPLYRQRIPNLHTDAFSFVSEVSELKTKPSIPYGIQAQNAFSHTPIFKDQGNMQRAILASGMQDVDVSGLAPENDINILGSSSDHTVIDPKNTHLKVGDELRFNLNYASLLAAMTSPYVQKTFNSIYEREGIL